MFLTFLKSYQKSFAWKFGTTKHVAGLLQYLTKKDYAPLLREVLLGHRDAVNTRPRSAGFRVIPPPQAIVCIEWR